jgi:CSLREA domain-containing protein
MVSLDPKIRRGKCESARATQTSSHARMRAVLVAAIATAFALASSTAARAAITVTTLSDPAGPSGTCSLRDAITAANTMTATNGCHAGTGSDRIQFSVTGTISLTSTLPEVTDSLLTIKGPASPGITVDGGGFGGVQVMQVASGATLSLDQLAISNGSSSTDPGGAILNHGTLSVTNSAFSGNITRSGVGFLRLMGAPFSATACLPSRTAASPTTPHCARQDFPLLETSVSKVAPAAPFPVRGR